MVGTGVVVVAAFVVAVEVHPSMSVDNTVTAAAVRARDVLAPGW